MEYIEVGKIVTTHGLQGECKVKTTFPYPERAFMVGKTLFLGNEKKPYQINRYRHQPPYELLTFDSITSIDQMIPWKQTILYSEKNSLKLSKKEYLPEELLFFTVLLDGTEIGSVKEVVMASPKNILLRIEGTQSLLLPCQEHFLKEIDFSKKQLHIYIEEGMLHED